MNLHVTDRTRETILDTLTLDEDDIIQAAHDALTQPSDSAWRDEDMWTTHTLMFATPDPDLTDEYTIGHSNYRSVLRDAIDAYPEDVEAASFGHWTYSRFVAIKVRVCTDDGEITPAYADLYSISLGLENDYPLYDEQDYSELEWQIWERGVDSTLSDSVASEALEAVADRYRADWETDFREFLSEHHFNIEGWISDEAAMEAVEYANSRAGVNVSIPDSPLF